VGACVAFMREHPRAGVIGGLIYPVFEDGRERPGDFGEYAVYLAIRELGEEVFEYSLPGDFPPCGAGMTGPTALFRRILTEFPACLTGRKGNSLASGEDVEMGTIAMRLGYESWYAPTLRLGHVLPARRLEKEYLEKLKAGCAEANVWIDYLAGRKQGGGWAGRWGHLGRGVLLGLRAAKLSVLEKLPREDRELLRWWRMESAAQGRTERFLFRRNPWPEVEELLRGTEFRMSESVSS
ncbi:MAG TPA: hypothetical protein VM008_15070, partial [Phycisphaerae bacterium]|nr:hypothetical protein [Phycisphaerae bacterium]